MAVHYSFFARLTSLDMWGTNVPPIFKIAQKNNFYHILDTTVFSKSRVFENRLCPNWLIYKKIALIQKLTGYVG